MLDAPVALPTLLSAPSCTNSRYATPLSIAIVGESLLAGGAERQIVNLARELAARNRAVLVLTLRSEERRELRFFLDEVAGLERLVVRNAMPLANAARRLIEVSGQSHFDAFRESLKWAPLDVRGDIIRLAAELHAARPDVVHGFQDAPGIGAAFAALAVGTPRIIASGRNLHPEHFSHARPYMRAAYRVLVEHGSVLLTNNSAAGARSYAEWLSIQTSAIRVVRNGISTQAFVVPSAEEIAAFRKKIGLLPGEFLVGGMFRLQEEKRPLLWLEAAVNVHRKIPNTRFVVFGEGTMRNQILKASTRAGFKDRLLMPGNTSEARVAIAALDVLLLTSSIEGTPNVLLEAGSLGVPVVATDAGGVPETMIDGEMGLLVREDKVGKHGMAAALADAIVSVLAGRISRGQATVGPDFVRARFGLERMVEETLALYEEPTA